MDCGPPHSSVHGIFQARVLEWVAISFSSGPSWPRDRTRVSCIVGRCFTIWVTREAPTSLVSCVNKWSAAAAAKLLQSCPTLCNPIDGSPLGSPVPGILQARTLEWVAISLSNAWKWKVKVKLLSRARLLATPWTAAHQAPPSMGFSRQEYCSGVPLPSPNDLQAVSKLLSSSLVLGLCAEAPLPLLRMWCSRSGTCPGARLNEQFCLLRPVQTRCHLSQANMQLFIFSSAAS